MPSYCAVLNCNSNAAKTNSIRFFRFPSAIGKNRKFCPLRAARRDRWIAALHRKDFTVTQNSQRAKYSRICSRHFHSGNPSELNEKDHPDWVPSLNMGYHSVNFSKNLNRFGRLKNTTFELSPNLSSIDCSPDPNNAKLEIEQEEDTSNAEEFLTKQADSELYCRLCLCVSQDSNSYINIFPSGGASSTRQEKILQMLQDIIPDLDLTLTYNPGICSDCEARLIASYDFISSCTQNQDTLRNYKSRSAGRFVNIHAVVEAHNPTKKRKMIASSAKGKKQERTLAKGINEDAVSESGNRNVANLISDTETTIEHIEIKVEEVPDIHEDLHEYFESMEGIGDQSAFIQSYSISTEQADDRLSLYETASNIPASLGEETGHVIAEHTQPIIDNIQSDVSIVRSESLNVGNVPLNVGSRFRIKIVEPRTYGSKSKSNNSAKK